MKQKMLILLCMPLFVALFQGCSMKKMLADSMVPTLQDTAREFFAEKNTRMGREAAPGLLKTLDGIIAGSPYNYDLLLLGAQLRAGFALAFIEDDDTKWAKVLYQKGFEYMLRAFDNTELSKAVQKNPAELKKVLSEYGTSWVPWMFWAGNCMASDINLRRDEMGAIAKLSTAKVFVDRILELEQGDYYYGGSYVVLGIFYGSRAKLGGSSKLSKENFEKALASNKRKFLLFHVLYAKYYAAQAECLTCKNGENLAKTCQNCKGSGKKNEKECALCQGFGKIYCSSCKGTGQEVKIFKELLTEVIEAPSNILPKETLANLVAKEKAKKMMENIHKYFNFPVKPANDPFQKKLTQGEKEEKAEEDSEMFNEMEEE